MGNCGQSPCGDIYSPPSRHNMSLFAILELVVMIVVGILCCIELFDLFKNDDMDLIVFLVLLDDVLVVCALAYIIYGLFWSTLKVRTGIYLFFAGAVLAMVIIVLELDRGTKKVLYKIAQFFIFLFLSYFLWKQANRL